MASAWWKSWGLSWGDSWGNQDTGGIVTLSGSGSMRFDASAELTLEGAPPEPQPEPGFGGALPWREWVRRPKEEDEALLLAVLD